jgi:hypothetical protein
MLFSCLAVLLVLMGAQVAADQLYYENTNAESVNNENLLQSEIPNVVCDIRTANTYLAGSTDQILITFIGEFSNSGPHAVGPFTQGENAQVTVALTRVIGGLEKVLLQKAGSDSYLLGHMHCRVKNLIYEMTGPRQWLDKLDVATETNYPASKGFESNAQESDAELPAATTLMLTIRDKAYYYTETGIYEGLL